MQQRMARTVGRRASALYGFFTKIGGMAAKGALIDGAIGVAVERHAKVLELVDSMVGLATHELDGILIAQPIGALDGVVHVPVPVVFAHVAERRPDTALRC